MGRSGTRTKWMEEMRGKQNSVGVELIRECLSIMGLPEDFILQGGLKNLNHICI